MSYCVNCGVKLNQNANTCPLCDVSVYNPNEPSDQSAGKNSPQSREEYSSSFDRGLWIKIVSIVIAVSILVSITINLVFGSGVNWSLYVASSLGLVWIWLISPFLFNRIFTSRLIVIDISALLGFLYFIEKLTPHQGWFKSLALPIITTFSILILSLVFLIKRKVINELYITAALFLSIGVFCMILNGFINLYIQKIFKLDWSLLVLIPFTAFAIIASLLQQRKWIVEELKHWFRI
jgi:hypothetical protein